MSILASINIRTAILSYSPGISHVEFEGSLSKVPNNILPVKIKEMLSEVYYVTSRKFNGTNKSKVLPTLQLTDIRFEDCITNCTELPDQVT